VVLISPIDLSGWLAVYTRHQHEKTVASLLAPREIDVFLPLYPVPHRWSDRCKTLLFRLFAGYAALSFPLKCSRNQSQWRSTFRMLKRPDRCRRFYNHQVSAGSPFHIKMRSCQPFKERYL
jgi:hypothetical protein